MSVIASKTRTELEVAAVTGRIEAITSLVPAVTRFLRKTAMTSQPEHRLVVVPHQFFEGGAVAALRFTNQHCVVNAA